MTRKGIQAVLKAKYDGRCKICGWIPGTIGLPLTQDERHGLNDMGFVVSTNAVGDDIASSGIAHSFSDARLVFHMQGHPKPKRLDALQRLLQEDF